MCTSIGALVSGSIAQPATRRAPPDRVMTSTAPNGAAASRAMTVIVRQPSAVWSGGPSLMAYTQTLCTPGVASKVASKPWNGPDPGYTAPTSLRSPLAFAAIAILPSTHTCTSIGAVVSGSMAQPATLIAPFAPETVSNEPNGRSAFGGSTTTLRRSEE